MLQLLVELDHLKNLIKEPFSEYATIDKILSREDSSTYRLGQSTVVFGAWFILLKAPNLLFHLIKLSSMLTVSFIKLVPCSKGLIKALGNFYILLSQGFPVINSMIQSLRFKEGSIGNILQVQQMMGILRWIDC